MSRTVEQIGAQQLAKIAHDLAISRGVKAMAAIVATDSINLEAACIPSDRVTRLKNRDTSHPAARKLVCRSDA